MTPVSVPRAALTVRRARPRRMRPPPSSRQIPAPRARARGAAPRTGDDRARGPARAWPSRCRPGTARRPRPAAARPPGPGRRRRTSRTPPPACPSPAASRSRITPANWRDGAQPPGLGTLARRFTATTSTSGAPRSASIRPGKTAGSSYMPPVPSSGLRGVPKSGSARRRASTVAGARGGSSSPARSAASATRPHSPPSPLRTATRPPARAAAGAARSVSVSIISLRLDTVATPLWRSAAATISGVPASEPVWLSMA